MTAIARSGKPYAMVAIPLGTEPLAVGVLPCSVEVLQTLLHESFLIQQKGLEASSLGRRFCPSQARARGPSVIAHRRVGM